jgi:hypothetical protein
MTSRKVAVVSLPLTPLVKADSVLFWRMVPLSLVCVIRVVCRVLWFLSGLRGPRDLDAKLGGLGT